MRHFYLKLKRLSFLIAFLCCAFSAQAYDAEVDGIYYNFSYTYTEVVTLTLSVTHLSNNSSFNESAYTGAVVIPETVTYEGTTYRVTGIGSRAFRGCTGLTSITIPNSVTSIGSNAFDGCSGLKKVIVNDIAAWCNISFGNDYANPLYYAHHLYSDENTEITDLVIPNDVTRIEGYAFSGCTGLTSITIPNSVTSIGGYAFSNTAWYNNQPDGVVYAGKLAYTYKGTMPENTSIVLQEETWGIADHAFDGCTSLTSIDIPNSVTSIGIYAFQSCTGLTSITIPNSMTSIEDYTFSGCSGLTSVTIPNSVTSIGGYAFYQSVVILPL